MKRIFCLIMAGLLIFAGCQKGDVVVEDTGDKTAYALILNNEASDKPLCCSFDGKKFRFSTL